MFPLIGSEEKEKSAGKGLTRKILKKEEWTGKWSTLLPKITASRCLSFKRFRVGGEGILDKMPRGIEYRKSLKWESGPEGKK